MSARLTLATGGRVLRQIRHDPRTIGLLVVVPCVLLILMRYVFDAAPQVFDRIGAPVLGIFPFTVMFVVMFLVTSIATLRERRSGTLERLLTLPLGKADLLGGYAVAFGALAALQAAVATAFSIFVLGLDVAGNGWLLLLVAVVDAVLGTALGLFTSAFAATEFQAVQFLPAFVLPQFLLCGLLVPREALPDVLHAISDVLPLSYAVDAMHSITTSSSPVGEVTRDLLIVLAFAVVALAAGAATLRRRTA